MDYDHFWFLLYVNSLARWPRSPRLWYHNTRALCPLGYGVNHLTSLVGLMPTHSTERQYRYPYRFGLEFIQWLIHNINFCKYTLFKLYLESLLVRRLNHDFSWNRFTFLYLVSLETLFFLEHSFLWNFFLS